MILIYNQKPWSLLSSDFSLPTSLPLVHSLSKGILCEKPQTALDNAKGGPDLGGMA